MNKLLYLNLKQLILLLNIKIQNYFELFSIVLLLELLLIEKHPQNNQIPQ